MVQLVSKAGIYAKGDDGLYYVKQNGVYKPYRQAEQKMAESLFNQAKKEEEAKKSKTPVNNTKKEEQKNTRPANAKTVYGSKSGRYYVKDEKTGKIKYYASNGTEIKKEYFLKIEKAFINEDGEIKAYNWLEKTKAAGKGVGRFFMDMVSSEQPVRDKNGKVVRNKDGSIKTARKFDLGRTATTVVVGAGVAVACVATAPVLAALGVAAGTAAAIGTGVQAAIGGYFVYQGGKKIYVAEKENQRSDLTNEQRIKNWEDKGAGGVEAAMGIAMVKGAGKGYSAKKSQAANTSARVQVKNQATLAQKGKLSVKDNISNRWNALKETTKPSLKSTAVNVGKGIKKAVVSTGQGIKNFVTHPIKTTRNAAKAYGKTWVDAAKGYKDAFLDVKSDVQGQAAEPTGYEGLSLDELSVETQKAAGLRNNGQKSGELTPEEVNIAREVDARLAKEAQNQATDASVKQLKEMKKKLREADIETPEARINEAVKNSANPKGTYKKLIEQYKHNESALKQIEMKLKKDKSMSSADKAELYRDLFKKQHKLNPEKYPDVETEIERQQVGKINNAKSLKELEKLKEKEGAKYSQEVKEVYEKKYNELQSKNEKGAEKSQSVDKPVNKPANNTPKKQEIADKQGEEVPMEKYENSKQLEQAREELRKANEDAARMREEGNWDGFEELTDRISELNDKVDRLYKQERASYALDEARVELRKLNEEVAKMREEGDWEGIEKKSEEIAKLNEKIDHLYKREKTINELKEALSELQDLKNKAIDCINRQDYKGFEELDNKINAIEEKISKLRKERQAQLKEDGVVEEEIEYPSQDKKPIDNKKPADKKPAQSTNSAGDAASKPKQKTKDIPTENESNKWAKPKRPGFKITPTQLAAGGATSADFAPSEFSMDMAQAELEVEMEDEELALGLVDNDSEIDEDISEVVAGARRGGSAAQAGVQENTSVVGNPEKDNNEQRLTSNNALSNSNAASNQTENLTSSVGKIKLENSDSKERTLSPEEMKHITETVKNANSEEDITFALQTLKDAGVFKGRRNLRKLLNRKRKLLRAQNNNDQPRVEKFGNRVQKFIAKVEANAQKTDENFKNKMIKKGHLNLET